MLKTLGFFQSFFQSNFHYQKTCFIMKVRVRVSHGGGGFALPTPLPARFTLLLLRYWLPRAKLCSFSAKSDRCDSTTRCSDGPRRCNRGSMKFNTFAEGIFLRLPRSYRVAEKSSQIGSREPNCAVFQQNPTVVTADLEAPMESDAVVAQA